MNRSFCCDDFWNINETWNTDDPDFSVCFQSTLFVLVPCVLFWIAGIIELWNISRFTSFIPLPWTSLNITKLVLSSILLTVSVIWCAFSIHQLLKDTDVGLATALAAVSRSVTYIIIIALMLKHRTSGVVTSNLLSCFWICFTIFGIIMHRSIIINKDRGKFSNYDFVCGMVYYPVIYSQLFLSIFVDSRSFDPLENGQSVDEASFLSSVTFAWFNKLVYIGIKRSLTVKDFFPLTISLKSTYLYQKFSGYWNMYLTSDDTNRSLALVLFKAFWMRLIASIFLDLVFVTFLFFPPLLLDRILEFVNDDMYTWRGYLYCIGVFVSVLMFKCLLNNCINSLLFLGIQVKSALINAIYRKNLLLSCSGRRDFTSGSITNLVSVDVSRISGFSLHATSLISAPFRITLIIYVMWQYLGPACLAGFAVTVSVIPISFFISRKNEKYIGKQMELKDGRLKLMNEILNGIKILKLYAWEMPFSSEVSSLRNEEIKQIRLSQLCYVAISFVFSCAPILVSIASFTTFVMVDPKNILSPTVAFVSLNLLEQLRFALFHLPGSISELMQALTSLERIRKFLTAENSDDTVIGKNTRKDDAVSINHATFSWSKDSEFFLRNITLHVPEGKLLAVIGPVGCGKSSLLSAALGEMIRISGSIDVKGNIAYVPQEAWILNRTLKNNVLLTRSFNEDKYKQVLKCCCLEPDLKILPGGDETEIGEKGINLSGGQKHRVSLARAVYQDRDLYLMDDPLSAVDAHVRKALFKDVISNDGMLKGKTRILATHDISVLPQVDLIVRMDEGEIVEVGTYDELMKTGRDFKKFIEAHTSKHSEAENPSSNKLLNRSISTSPDDNDIDSQSDIKRSISQVSEKQAADLIDEEKMEEGGVKRGIYLNYAKHLGFVLFFIALFGYMAFITFEALSFIWVAKWSGDSVSRTQSHSETMYRLSVYSALGGAQAVTFVLGLSVLVYASTKAAELYHCEMLNSIMKSPMSFFDTTPLGRIINRFSTDMDILDVRLVYSLDEWIKCFLFCISTFVVIGMKTPVFLAAILPLAVIYYVLLKLHLNTSRQIKRLESTTRSPIYSHLLESIQGVMSIKAFKVQKEFIEKLQENVDCHIACSYQTNACNRWLAFLLDLIGSCIVLIATYLAIENRGTLGPAVVGLIMTYSFLSTDALMFLIKSNTELENQSVAVERIDEYCQLQSEAPWQAPGKDPDSKWPDDGTITFDNYSMKYRENLDLILHDINLNVLPNEKIGIVGRTGAGKSSITLALFRIIEPAGGTIYIDNVDISEIGLHALRKKLTIIPQDPVLFTGTLRFNIDPNSEYNDADIWTSLTNAHLRNFVSSLEEGLEYKIEENGSNLSAGQKQLLCLARALLKKTKILILDEATAAVDMDTDSVIQETIKSEFSGHTVITIAHRLNTVMDYDKVIVMGSGRVIEVGNPKELVQNRDSQFFKLARDAKLV